MPTGKLCAQLCSRKSSAIFIGNHTHTPVGDRSASLLQRDCEVAGFFISSVSDRQQRQNQKQNMCPVCACVCAVERDMASTQLESLLCF